MHNEPYKETLLTLIEHGSITGAFVLETLLSAVSLAVAAIPEGLVVVVTVLLSIGVTKMSKRNSIIRRLTAVETLGCTEVICSDKTGTLTQNKMTVVDHYGDETLLARAMALCSDVQTDPDGALIGDPTEVGLTAYAASLGFAKGELERTMPRVGEAPFDSVRKMMSTLHATSEGGFRQFTKGAPDVVLSRCDTIWLDGKVQRLTPEIAAAVLEENRRMAGKALRVLAAAYRDYTQKPQSENPESLETGLTLIGLTGMIDPIRPEVKAAIGECRKAGIRAIMITGDHRDTAVAIAKDLGLIADETEARMLAPTGRQHAAKFQEPLGRNAAEGAGDDAHDGRRSDIGGLAEHLDRPVDGAKMTAEQFDDFLG